MSSTEKGCFLSFDTLDDRFQGVVEHGDCADLKMSRLLYESNILL